MEQIEGAALEVLAGDVFQRLPAGPEVDAIAHLGVAGHGADARVFKVRQQLGDGVGGDDGVGVDADVNLLSQPVQRVVERRGLASVGLGEHLHAAGGDLGGVGLRGHLGGAVGRSVVDHDDVEILVIGVEHRADGADDDRLFVVGGDEDGNARVEARRGQGVGFAQAVDDSEDADEQQARAHQDVADKEDQDDEAADDLHAGEGDRVGQCAQKLGEGKLGHHFGGGLAHQRGDRDDGVAVGAQRVNQHRQCGHGGGAVAAPVVHKNHRPSELRLRLHDLQLREDGLGDLLGRLAGMLVPVVGVDLAADHDVALILDGHDGRGLVVGLRLFVDVVRRTEVKRLDIEFAGEEALGELDLQVELLG